MTTTARRGGGTIQPSYNVKVSLTMEQRQKWRNDVESLLCCGGQERRERGTLGEGNGEGNSYTEVKEDEGGMNHELESEGE